MAKGYKRKKRLFIEKEGYKGALLRMLPVVLMVAIVPLLMGQYESETGLTQYGWFGGGKYDYDFFLGWKSVVLTLLVFMMAGCVAVRFFREKKRLPFVKLFLPLFGYGVLVLVSGFASVNKNFSFSGSFEQFETVWVLLSYVLAVYYVFVYARNETELQVVADGVCFSATVIGVLGVLQGLGADLFVTDWFQKLITTDDILDLAGGTMGAKFGDHYAVATLYNPNYMGVYASFVVPFLVMMFLFEQNKWRRIWHVGNVVLVMTALVFSRSRAGLLATVLAVCIGVLFAVRKVLKRWFYAVPVVGALVVIVLLVNAFSDNMIFERLKNMFDKDTVEIAEEVTEDGTVIRKTGLTELYTTKTGVAFTYNEKWMQVSLYSDDTVYGFYAIDEKGEQTVLNPDDTGTEFAFEEAALADVKVMPVYIEEELGFKIVADGEWWFTYNKDKKKYQYLNDYNKESDMVAAKAWGFEEHQGLFSGRGYIWSRTLPLLKDTLFVGSGPDTFVLQYPQTEYLQMEKNGFSNQVVTKPHSWYLQIGVQTGVLSLLCLLVFYGWYAVWSIRLYAFKKLTLQTEAFGIAAFVASIGFMVSGISNDSMVVTSPVFWGLMGLGVTANFMVKKNRKQV